jgi:hypothetical protein
MNNDKRFAIARARWSIKTIGELRAIARRKIAESWRPARINRPRAFLN